MQNGNSTLTFEARFSLRPMHSSGWAIAALALGLGLAAPPVRPDVYPETEQSRRAEAGSRAGAERTLAHRRAQLDKTMKYLADPRNDRRAEVALQFSNFASLYPDAHPDMRTFAGWLRRDPDREVARWGETLAARLEGREPDPEIAPPYQPTPAELRQRRERWEGLLAQASAPTGELRRTALGQLVEIARRESRLDDPELRAALEGALADPSPRVSQFARFMLRGIDGDPHAFGLVYVRDAPRN